MTKTIGIIGGSISGNKGAEAMVTAVIGALRRRLDDAQFVVFSPYPKTDDPFMCRYDKTQLASSSPASLLFKTFPLALLHYVLGRGFVRSCRATRLLQQCDVLLDVGGITFSDGREIFLPFNVLTIWPAMLLDCPVIKLSQACGPFRHWLNRNLARKFLPHCHCVVARGSHTAENLSTLSLSNVLQCPDVSFLLNELDDMTVLDESLSGCLRFGSPARRRLVGISPSSLVHQQCRAVGVDYVGLHGQFVQYLIAQNYRVLLLPHSARFDTDKLRNNDLPVARRIKALAGDSPEVAVTEDQLDAIALRKLIGRCDFFLASRFHSMISALAMGVPVMVCGWGHKYFEMLDLFGQRSVAFDYRELSLDHMKDLFQYLRDQEQDIKRALASALPGVMSQSAQQIDAAVDLLQARSVSSPPPR